MCVRVVQDGSGRRRGNVGNDVKRLRLDGSRRVFGGGREAMGLFWSRIVWRERGRRRGDVENDCSRLRPVESRNFKVAAQRAGGVVGTLEMNPIDSLGNNPKLLE